MADWISRIFIIALLLVIVVSIFVMEGDEVPAAPAPPAPAVSPTFSFDLDDVDFDDISESVLETIHQEGFDPVAIDYDDPVLNARKIFLTTDIDWRQAERVMKQLVYLDAKAPGEEIDLYIDSNGGTCGYTLANFFRTLRSPVNTWCLDWCQSGGAIVLAGGTGKRRAYASGRVILHMIEESSGDDDDDEYDPTTLTMNTRVVYWKARAKLPDRFLTTEEEASFHLNAEQALEFGVIDEIVPDRR